MKVSELARLAGVAPSAVRWYEEIGALPPAVRTPNGYRSYDERDLARLRLVVSLRRLGLEPARAGHVARLCLERGTISDDLAPLLASQHLKIARQRADLDQLEAELDDLEATILAADRARRSGADATSGRPIRVLFVCTGNSGRSQIAEALVGHLGGSEFEAVSAGTDPRPVSRYAVQALADLGIDWRGAASKSIDRYLGQAFDYRITVCDRARETCPTLPDAENALHWGIDDPAEVGESDEAMRAAYARTRDDLRARLGPFVEIARLVHARNRPLTFK